MIIGTVKLTHSFQWQNVKMLYRFHMMFSNVIFCFKLLLMDLWTRLTPEEYYSYREAVWPQGDTKCLKNRYKGTQINCKKGLCNCKNRQTYKENMTRNRRRQWRKMYAVKCRTNANKQKTKQKKTGTRWN